MSELHLPGPIRALSDAAAEPVSALRSSSAPVAVQFLMTC